MPPEAMLHELPVTNVRLLACREDWQRMTPTEQGRYCQSCNREVLDFTQATAADVAQARTAAAAGRVCGYFRLTQLAGGRPVRFGLWARAFVLALALVFGQGLTAHEAWAQTRKPAAKASARVKRPPAPPETVRELPAVVIGITIAPPAVDSTKNWGSAESPYTFVDQMPEFPGGAEALQQFLQAGVRYPVPEQQGKVFIDFIVTPDGRLLDPQVLKGPSPAANAEAMRLVRLMPRWKPGRQRGAAVHVRYTLPVLVAPPLDAAR
ncbi:energy transducer TonB [Hymenobacter sp. 15J16-1T3B]|uniref:energy transducer TonB n=1 Tax=Hymenobacter sp. 15J16-1T3B TaxID=2886941 RepID=UPI001D112717|nr:energy transducer TonB [Hymenobacter sp. 15J16-1T3B]MCC3156332.1 energy transducer TonB [Hymenobacter sp. 15J16-1T3B]